MAAIPQAMGEAFDALMTHAGASGAQFAGPPFCLYPGEVGEHVDFVLCMPVAPGATAEPGVELEEVPGGTVASTMHHGPYSTMETTSGALHEWMAANEQAAGRSAPRDLPQRPGLGVRGRAAHGDRLARRMSPIDLVKQLKPLYAPSAKHASIVEVPELVFVMIDGRSSSRTPRRPIRRRSAPCTASPTR